MIPAISYDQAVHQSQIDEKQKVVKILNAAISSGKLVPEKVAVLQKKVNDLNHEINEVHQSAVDADASYIKQINAQKDELILNRDISNNTIKQEKEAAKGQNGVMLNYQTGQYFYTTLLKVDYNYGRDDAFQCDDSTLLVKEDSASASGWVGYYLRPELTWYDNDLYEVNKSDHEMTKKTNYQQVTSPNDMDTMQSNALKRKTSLYNQLYSCCSVSSKIDRTEATAFKNDGSPLYHHGFQWASKEQENDIDGCDKDTDKVAFHRSVKVYEKSNPTVLKEIQTIYKSWRSKLVQSHNHEMVSNTWNPGLMVLLLYAPAAQKQLNWTKGSAYGLEILQILSTDKPEITIDGNRLSEDQFVVNKTGTTRTATIKISALQNLSVGKHTLVITENNVPTTYELNINEKSISDYEIISAGDYTVDADSLTETLENYEALYPDAVVSLDLNISYQEGSIDESDAKGLKERYGERCLLMADVSLDVYADGEFVETATPDMIEGPVKISFTCPVAELNNPRIGRIHDGELSELTTEKNEDGEGITIDAENNTLTLEASNFSTYALVVDAASASPLTGITQSNAVPFVVIGCCLVTLAVLAVLLVLKKRKKRKL